MLKYHIQTIDVPSGGSPAITFNNIPQIYDDLLVLLSGRSNASGQPSLLYRINNSNSGYSGRSLFGYASGVFSGTLSTLNSVNAGGDWGRLDYEGFNYAASTSNTFSNIQFYLPNYTSSNPKAGSVDIAVEDVSASPLRWWNSIVSSLWSGTQPITSLSFALYEGSFEQNSSISLYGIKRGADGRTEVASGGAITTSGGFTIHTFTGSGTFTANRDLNIEYLVIGGGGGGAHGGGGAGGYRCSVAGESSGGGASAEQRLFVTRGTTYAVTVGAGGPSGFGITVAGGNGGPSEFAGITAAGGGRAGSVNAPSSALAGGSGGGAGGSAGSASGGAGISGQGFAGGNSTSPGSNQPSGGGGGAGGAGSPNSGLSSGAGGAGVTSSITGTAVARGGGGGGGQVSTNAPGSATAGGGAGTWSSNLGNSGTANTGGGGGGAGFDIAGGSGGSGIVIIRYLTPA